MTENELESLDPRAAQAELKAATLIESLPWLKRFSGEIVVIKFGGNAMVGGKHDYRRRYYAGFKLPSDRTKLNS